MRGRFPLVAAAILAGAGAFWGWRAWTSPSGEPGPFVLISIDTLRADRLPAYGYSRTRTPNIDRLISDGVLFEHAYAHSPQTLPSHASILSGRLPFEHGVRDNIGFAARPAERFLPHALREHGFATGAFVSSYVLRPETRLNQGFETYDADLPPASPEQPLGEVQRPGGDTIAAAIRWIDGRQAPRFFLFAHIYEPHAPYTPPPRHATGDPYDGEVAHADEIVGALLDHLRTRDLYDAATIVLLSDHGEGLGDHGEDEHGIFLYRETIQVPLIIKLPSRREAGRRVSAPVQHIDLLPTLLDLAGAGAIAGLRGRSLRPLLEGTGSVPDRSIYSESLSPRYHFGWSELYALTDDRYRFIRAPRDELYDLAQDPREATSLAAARPQVRAAMRRALDALIANVPVTAPSAVSAEDRQRLAALGYVGPQTAAPLSLPGDRLPDPKDKLGVLQKYRRAAVLASEGRTPDAIGLYRELLREEPSMTDVWLQLAGAYERSGRTADAVAAYREVIARKPDDAAALIGAANGLLRLGLVDDARAHAELAVRHAPAAAHELLARIALERGDASAAREQARLARSADPSLPLAAFVEGAIAYREGRYADAVPHLLEAREALARRTEQMIDVNYLAADALARLERYAEAERLFLDELRVFPGHARARAGLAMLYRATGRVAESDRAIAELLRSAPTREGYELAAQLWTMFGRLDRAAAMRAEASKR